MVLWEEKNNENVLVTVLIKRYSERVGERAF